MRNCTKVLWGSLGLWIWAANGLAGPCAPWVSRVVSVQGIVEVKRLKESGWSRVKLQDQFCAGDSVRAELHSRAGLLLRNETLLRLDQGTTLILPELAEEDSAWLNLLRGALHFISNIPYRLKVKTPFVNAAIEGTEFAVRVTDSDAKVWVVEGEVLVENRQGSIRLGSGEAALAESGKAPVPYLRIKPRDAVQWALYYPPIIDYRPGGLADSERQRAIGLYRTGQIPAAIEILESIPDDSRDSSFFTQRAALLLSVGEVESARRDIEQALALAPGSGTPLALQSIIELTRNDKQKALSLAEKAVQMEPRSSTPLVALSYSRQAAFDIEGAKESIQKALELAPDDPLAWARLAELQLSTGELDEALESARKAEALDPDLSHTQMVLGFARLLQIDIDEAKESFDKAIVLDPSAPLPRLGLGLAKIREGDVEEGTKDIEIAAVLDPENSLVR
ncbi:MAG: tetratricopeptide repeat protein, partial [Methylococcaceae bacterium]|nr:tetratricopeptide repeat protein [Methylococcaceae bacterium]MCI0733030.1 tetratricopeptide repeat protein [Methylococcaceae bacterium]